MQLRAARVRSLAAAPSMRMGPKAQSPQSPGEVRSWRPCPCFPQVAAVAAASFLRGLSEVASSTPLRQGPRQLCCRPTASESDRQSESSTFVSPPDPCEVAPSWTISEAALFVSHSEMANGRVERVFSHVVRVAARLTDGIFDPQALSQPGGGTESPEVGHGFVQDRVPHRPAREGELISVVAPTSFVRHGFHPLLYEPL